MISSTVVKATSIEHMREILESVPEIMGNPHFIAFVGTEESIIATEAWLRSFRPSVEPGDK